MRAPERLAARLSASGRPTHPSGDSRPAGPIRVPLVVDTVFKDDTSQCFSQMKFIFSFCAWWHFKAVWTQQAHKRDTGRKNLPSVSHTEHTHTHIHTFRLCCHCFAPVARVDLRCPSWHLCKLAVLACGLALGHFYIGSGKRTHAASCVRRCFLSDFNVTLKTTNKTKKNKILGNMLQKLPVCACSHSLLFCFIFPRNLVIP